MAGAPPPGRAKRLAGRRDPAHNEPMHALVPFGRGLIALAMLSLVGELTARAFLGAGGYLSAEDLWVTLAPDSYAAMRAWFRHGALPLWMYGLGPVLKLPAWGLFGAPGIAALWVAEKSESAAEIDAITEAAFLYDELEKQAKEEGLLGDNERLPAGDADDILASAREAEADLVRDPIRAPPPDAGVTAAAGEEPPTRPPS